MGFAIWGIIRPRYSLLSAIIALSERLLCESSHYEQLAEGYYTVKALCLLEQRYQVELPICQTVYQVLYEEKDPKASLDALFTRSLKNEF